MLPLLRLVSALGPIVAVLFVRTDRRLVNTLRDAGAVGSGAALALEARNALTRWRLSRLMHGGAIRSSGPGRFYFDPAGYAGYRRARRIRALILLAVGVVAAVVWRTLRH